MKKYVKINESKSITFYKEIKNFLAPDYVYIPYGSKAKILIKDNDKVFMNQIILKDDDKSYFSSVSGKIIGVCKMNVDGINIDNIIIENDFMEKDLITHSRKNLYNYDKKNALDILDKYSNYHNRFKYSQLLISGIDIDVYERNFSYLLDQKIDDVLECISVINNIFGYSKCILALSNNDSNVINKVVNQIGTFPDIELKMFDKLYPLGRKEVLVKEVYGNNLDVDFFNVEEIFNIYNILKKGKPVNQKLITFSGNLLNKSKVINCKIGSSISEILNEEFKIKDQDYHMVINGLLSGYEINDDHLIVTENINSVFINSNIKLKKSDCINCGLCINNCPMDVNPRNKKNIEKCINCGLCSYLCPTNTCLGGENFER